MTREEKCELAIEKGYTYDQETGKIYSRFNKEITSKFKTGYHFFILIDKNKKRHQLLAHIFGWYCINKECVEQIDHINGIKDDNRILNLRSVNNQQNHFNRITAKGYYWNKRVDKWQCQIMLNNKSIHLGYFEKEEDARAAYLEAKEKYHTI
jgi:hypothetical protein